MKRNAGSDRAVVFVNNLTHTSGPFAGQSFNLRPWQERKIVRPLFRTGPDGRRVYRTCLLMLPRKNGKSSLAAAIALYGLLGDSEMSAYVVSAAADREQASLVFHIAVQMVRHDPVLSGMCEIIESQKRIVHRASGSVYRAISSESYSKHGANISMLIYDELHAAPNRDLWDVLTTSMGARSQPLTLAISTAGYDRHSILWELYEHARKVKEQPELDPTFLPIIYEAAQDDDWTDEKVWHKANPALGDFRSMEDMRIACERAKQIPAQENTFRRLFLDQWTEQAERWMPMAAWNACQRPIDWSEYRNRACYVGMDLSTTTDLTAIVALFPEDDGGFSVLPCCFVPEDTIRLRSQRDHRPYQLWRDQGKLEATSGNVVDYEAVRVKLNEWNDLYDIKAVAYDPYNATDLVNRLMQQDGLNCVPVKQGMLSLSGPTKELTKAILSGKLRHDGHPVLGDHIGNAAIEKDAAENFKLSKSKSTEKIDAAAALVCAIDQYSRQSHAPPPDYDVIVLGR